MVKASQKAVGKITKGQIDETRRLKIPPTAIIDVFKVLLIMLGARDTSWNGVRTFLSNRGVIDQILEFDPR